MNFFKRFSITFGNKKNKCLPEVTVSNDVKTLGTISTESDYYKTLAIFDLNIESPKYIGAIPDATIKFYPLK